MARRPLLRGHRLRRGPALALLVVLAVVGSVVILATQLRPSLYVGNAVTVADAAQGTTYALDELVCVVGAQTGATVRDVTVEPSPGLALEVRLPPPDTAPVVAFPVDPGLGRPVAGAAVGARDATCLRLLLRGDRQGTLPAPQVRVALRYGPAGLFRRTLTVRPPVVLEVDRTGRDPRLDAG